MMKFIQAIIVLSVISLIIFGCSEKTTEPDAVLPQTVATPEFSIEEGHYNTAKTITITCETEESEIRFTLDGSVPTDSSEVYVEPFVIAESAVVKAKGFKDGWIPSDTASLAIDIEPLPNLFIEILNVQEAYNLEQIVAIRAFVSEEDNTPVPDGTDVLFSADGGFFYGSGNSGFAYAKTMNGHVLVPWSSGTISGALTFKVKELLTGVEAEQESYILPGHPATFIPTIQYHGLDEIWLPYPEQGLYASEIYGLRLKVEIKDVFGNPVSAGNAIIISISIIPINPIVTTDADGIAYFTIDIGSHTGVVVITIGSETLSFIVLEPGLN